ncbi:Phosducin-like protein 3 [Tyrophagus putrescentiae]|nr:Phosducin-like protein 3 [Tyrophagus putrescentiae]
MEDTEWNDILKKHGIIKDEPKKEEEVEPEPEPKEIKFNNSDEEEAWLEENDDDDFIRQYREKRLNEIQVAAQQARFGDVVEITASDYVMQVNRAGEGIWVVLLLYQQGHSLCKQMQNIFDELAPKFPATKFLKSIATLCVPNFPDSNLPAVFVYRDSQLIKQFIGPMIFGSEKITNEEVEWIIATSGAITTTMEEDPRRKMAQSRKFYEQFDSDSE